MKKTKNILIFLGILVLTVVIIAGCKVGSEVGVATATTLIGTVEISTEAGESVGAATTQIEAEESESVGTVAVIVGGLDAPWASFLFGSIVDGLKEGGAEVMMMDAQWDPAIQNTLVDDAIASDVDLIAIYPIDPLAVIPALKKAYDAGVPVMPFNIKAAPEGDQYIIGFSGIDLYNQAQVAIKLIADAIGGEGNLAIVEGTPGSSVSIEFIAAVTDYIKDNNLNIKIVASQPTDWSVEEGTKVAEDFLTRYKDLDAIFAFDDYLASGVKIALEEAGYKPGEIKLVGINGCSPGINLIKQGWMYGTVHQPLVAEGRFEAGRAIEFLKTKEKLDPFYEYIINNPITKENVNEIVPEF